MRVSREEAERNRKRVVATAGKLFRTHGFDGVGIAELMKEAGLTHGGFYKQFDSKADLEVEASAEVLRENAALWEKIVAKAQGDPLAALVAFYLSEKRLDQMSEGCGMATLSGDAARHTPKVRSAFTDGVIKHLDQLSDIVPGDDGEERRRHAMTTLATMVGALVLARAVDDRSLANELLEATRKDLLSRQDD